MIDHPRLLQWASVHGDSFFVYDDRAFRTNFRRLHGAFAEIYPNTRIAYSYKTNYTPEVCRAVDDLGGYAEVVSDMEWWLAGRLGVAPDRVVYNGPYKSAESLRAALTSGAILNIDSERDLKAVLEVADAHPDRGFAVGVRCNFAVGAESRSRFGVDVDGDTFAALLQAIRGRANLRLAGLHCHFPERDLWSFTNRTRRLLEVAAGVFAAPPDFLDIGGGFYSELPADMKAALGRPVPTFEEYARAICPLVRAQYGADPGRSPRLFIEPGTALVADAFRFYARVIDVRTVADRRIATVAASIFNISPTARRERPPIAVLSPDGASGTACNSPPTDIAGFTCIENDFLTRNAGRGVDVGDFLEYGNVGSYSVVMKPPFILPATPILMLREGADDPVLIKRREVNADVFSQFVALS